MWILLALVAGALIVLVVANLTSSAKKIEREIEHLYQAGDPQFVRSMGSLLGPGIVPGNTVRGLCNGDEIFPAMLAAIRSAKRTIVLRDLHLLVGIDRAGIRRGAVRASPGRREGPRGARLGRLGQDGCVHARRDEGSGSRSGEVSPAALVQPRPAQQPHPPQAARRGRPVGFTGGVGIADDWLGDAQDPEHWRDSHFRVEGPVVAQMQAAFMDNWIETCAQVLHGEEYFPELKPAGSHAAQVFKSSADDGSESVRLMYLLSIASAAKSVRIANAYFVPDDLAVATLVAARRRGVKVEIIVPGRHIDSEARAARLALALGTAAGGGRRDLRVPADDVSLKVMIVDDLWTSVGSTNFDNRSFRLNDEANLNILDAGFAAAQARVFEEDKARSRRISLEEWRRRPLRERIVERLAGLVRLQL